MAPSTDDAPDLLVAWCAHEACKYATTHWHYSGSMPAGRLGRFGAWEDGEFVGAVVFARGATPNLGRPYGLGQAECVELARVALRAHRAPVSRIVSRALVLLREWSPGVRLVVSFADPDQGHHGGVYQAGNWLYLGEADDDGARTRFVVHGEVVHPRTLGSRYGRGGQSLPWLQTHVDPNARRIHVTPKHRYVMPLDRGMRRRLAPLARPYPPRL